MCLIEAVNQSNSSCSQVYETSRSVWRKMAPFEVRTNPKKGVVAGKRQVT